MSCPQARQSFARQYASDFAPVGADTGKRPPVDIVSAPYDGHAPPRKQGLKALCRLGRKVSFIVAAAVYFRSVDRFEPASSTVADVHVGES